MRIIIIEDFPQDFPSIVVCEEGIPIIFETMEEAEKEASDCQNPIIVTLTD